MALIKAVFLLECCSDCWFTDPYNWEPCLTSIPFLVFQATTLHSHLPAEVGYVEKFVFINQPSFLRRHGFRPITFTLSSPSSVSKSTTPGHDKSSTTRPQDSAGSGRLRYPGLVSGLIKYPRSGSARVIPLCPAARALVATVGEWQRI